MRNASDGFIKKIKELILRAIIFFLGGGGFENRDFMRKLWKKYDGGRQTHRLQHNTAQKKCVLRAG